MDDLAFADNMYKACIQYMIYGDLLIQVQGILFQEDCLNYIVIVLDFSFKLFDPHHFDTILSFPSHPS